MNFFDHQHFYLVGIKGVAMTSLAQLLLDAGKSVSGSDQGEEFVTQTKLDQLGVTIDADFAAQLPKNTDCVIYTAAHRGKFNPQVQAAIKLGTAVYSQAEALSCFFNQKKGIAVCGVGGKSTVSAMIAWIFEKTGRPQSFSVGVGNILGLNKTGRWLPSSEYFIAEADEYVTDPEAIKQGEPAIARFSYLQPQITICTHLIFDHPDVYPNELATIQAFTTFFDQLKANGSLIINQADRAKIGQTKAKLLSFGNSPQADVYYQPISNDQPGINQAVIHYQKQNFELKLTVPGEYNLENATAACLAAVVAGVQFDQAALALASFQSTSRRFEKVGRWHGVELYDDYAHHPSEIKAVAAVIPNWFKGKTCLVAFQPHTYSRTKQLFDQFATALAQINHLVLLDIFASAREQADDAVSSQQLANAVSQITGQAVPVLHDYRQLAEYAQKQLSVNQIFLTLGAGNIYKAHQLLLSE
ncbi:MAG: hypothetical protein COY81_01205 [Candidatus Pacebacteria bacterium CG_4_10_14_0_8_um_filter_43_12]|nr:MAG: hypothetical protein COU66_03470 [Candidatus Pacebacteria bacterium CG10_big_fil_rev_8_21_14_0_10_44_11]PIY79714.1 MAG: hypothetical protein COY81_01205 [Candidatus Pacebacteria bacterium CG_4_10_14_0_8_um_filter_43_12]